MSRRVSEMVKSSSGLIVPKKLINESEFSQFELKENQLLKIVSFDDDEVEFQDSSGNSQYVSRADLFYHRQRLSKCWVKREESTL